MPTTNVISQARSAAECDRTLLIWEKSLELSAYRSSKKQLMFLLTITSDRDRERLLSL
ncbi:MAG TPA: hypothetical protein V6C85_35645 [Allocoleopsis sp.]